MAPTKYQAKILDNGVERYKRYQIQHKRYFGTEMAGRVLDFGCGAGGFVLAALEAGLDGWGVEVDKERQAQFQYITEKNFPQWRDRFELYEGRLLSYPSNHFDGIYSWFVFEHVTDPQTSLREISRVLKPLTFSVQPLPSCCLWALAAYMSEHIGLQILLPDMVLDIFG
ncbi:MAG: class I SAM-dependent methyltransferase [Cyanobacteria bacterium P01_E01_bin.34]